MHISPQPRDHCAYRQLVPILHSIISPLNAMEVSGSRSRIQDASPIPGPSDHTSRPTSSKSTRRREVEKQREVTTAVGPTPSIGQFSFAPATRTTVVTTTTTTTTNFPPLILNPPRSAHELNPKLYPLASYPTPSALRNFQFELDGQSVVFNEPEDTDAVLHEVRDVSPQPLILHTGFFN
jgi:F-box and WD-40 domain protein CDC4